MNMELWDSTVIPSQYRLQRMVIVLSDVISFLSQPIIIVPGVVCNLMAYKSLSQINISWTPPLRPNGVIIAYYRPSGPETKLNTTDLETSFSSQSDLEEGTEFIFSVRAYTRMGHGNASSITVSTLSSGQWKN